MPVPIDLKILNFLQKCTFKQLKQTHTLIITLSLHDHPQILSKFLQRTTEFGSMHYPNLIFTHLDGLYSTNTLLWNAMIRGYAYNGPFENCLNLFDEMLQRGIKHNNFTYPYVLTSCSQMGMFKYGERVHGSILKNGFVEVFEVSNGLFHFYLKMGDIGSARRVFDGMCSRPVELWNKMISGYLRVGDLEKGRGLFDRMVNRDVGSWNVMISFYAQKQNLVLAEDLFERMPVRNVVTWTTMVKAYATVGDVETARKVFEEMPERNVVSWNCMISSYMQNGKFREAVELFGQMQYEGIEPDGFTFVPVLSSYANLGDLDSGKWVHSLIKDWNQLPVNVGTSLVELYAKCGDINTAFTIFIKLENKDCFCYNVMIKSLASHGRAEEAIKIFYMLQLKGLKPNDVSFTSVLFACCHRGLVDEGRKIFHCIESKYGVSLKLEHYGCMVDLLCRNSHLEEAQLLVKTMPFKPDITIWGALLNGCRLKGDVKLAESIIDEAEKLKSGDESGVYVLLSNIHASTYQWLEAAGARKRMETRCIWKTTGSSSVF